MKALLSMTVAVALALSASDALASTRKAKRLFKRAETNYQLGRFEEALADYSQAYEAKPLPEFLFNIAQCHMELGHWEKALFFYEGFLRDRPDASNRALVEDLIADTKKRLAALEQEERDAEKRRLADAEAKKQEEERMRAEAESRRLQEERRLAEMRAAEREANGTSSKSGGFYQTWWFWTAVGLVTAAATGTAIAFTTGGDTIHVFPAGELGTIDVRP